MTPTSRHNFDKHTLQCVLRSYYEILIISLVFLIDMKPTKTKLKENQENFLKNLKCFYLKTRKLSHQFSMKDLKIFCNSLKSLLFLNKASLIDCDLHSSNFLQDTLLLFFAYQVSLIIFVHLFIEMLFILRLILICPCMSLTLNFIEMDFLFTYRFSVAFMCVTVMTVVTLPAL